MKIYDRFVALDVETTGLEQDAHIIEIGLVSVNQGKIVSQWKSLVRPPVEIPREITRLTGISNRMVENAPTWQEIEAEFLAQCGDRLLVAHNVPFDRGRIAFEMGRELENPWLDSHDLAKLFLPTLSGYKLAGIAGHLAIPNSAHHRALNDAYVCAGVVSKLLHFAKSLPKDLVEQMAALYMDSPNSLAAVLRDLADEASPHATTEVAEPPAPEGDHPLLAFDQAARFFAPDGLLAQALGHYEERPQQVEMCETICRAFADERHALIEAGTGTGKSFAYLVPALLWGRENERRVIVSTATIALQEQLYHTDIPLLSRLLDYPFRATISKGRNNYLCKRRFEQSLGRIGTVSANERLFLTSLVLWDARDASGDRERLNLNTMEEQFWQSIAATADTCLGRRCAHYRDCYYFANRRRAEESQLVIVNHSLLLQNARLDDQILPDHDRVVIDEAHHLEDEASRQFTEELDLELLRKSLNSLIRSQGLLVRIQGQVAKSVALAFEERDIQAIIADIQEEAKSLVDELSLFIQTQAARPELDRVSERRITDKIRSGDWWLDFAESLTRCLNGLVTLIRHLDRLAMRLAGDADLEAVYRELRFVYDQCSAAEDLAERVLGDPSEDFVYWVKGQRAGWGSNVVLYAARIDIMPLLKEGIFDKNKSVILTSATLAPSSDLGFVASRYLLAPESVERLICPSPFRHNERSMIAVPTDHPDYSKLSDIQYSRQVSEDLMQLIPACGGDMLVLFTSYAMLNRVYDSLKRNHDLKDYTILGHGKDGNRSAILARMRRERRTIVLGAASFWEGIDVPGDHLRTVVIAKLPFAPPTQPLESARAERLEAEGKNAFAYQSLPDAILRFRQGCGRLLRAESDYGAIVILDNRVLTKNYGRKFIQALPEQPLIRLETPALCQEVHAFLAEQERKNAESAE